jgi:hypothetical protein
MHEGQKQQAATGKKAWIWKKKHEFEISNIAILSNIIGIITCILIDTYALFCIFFTNRHPPATLTEVYQCFFLSRKANARVYLAKTGNGPHSS